MTSVYSVSFLHGREPSCLLRIHRGTRFFILVRGILEEYLDRERCHHVQSASPARRDQHIYIYRPPPGIKPVYAIHHVYLILSLMLASCTARWCPYCICGFAILHMSKAALLSQQHHGSVPLRTHMTPRGIDSFNPYPPGYPGS